MSTKMQEDMAGKNDLKRFALHRTANRSISLFLRIPDGNRFTLFPGIALGYSQTQNVPERNVYGLTLP
ncbi:hypothetical protein LB553_06200 [Mesorhizobium sp. CA8]|uniref:hypothetical protein n=1 Tax=Mesorhizobium sp. CA8 TaxID=2876637 RepID=UPI001CCC58BD|nr:hypothetical protein [Mesorhizobium sp. CA8]MBZ9760468.1 hypothetical protein [Mesorhizobium sp. CA8]